MTAQEWLNAVYEAPTKEETYLLRQMISDVMDLYDQAARSSLAGEPTRYILDQLDDYFRLADPSRMPIIQAVGLLRTAFTARLALPNWISFRDKAYAAYESQGDNMKEIFVGLFDKPPRD
jgi:hypothetical protein